MEDHLNGDGLSFCEKCNDLRLFLCLFIGFCNLFLVPLHRKNAAIGSTKINLYNDCLHVFVYDIKRRKYGKSFI